MAAQQQKENYQRVLDQTIEQLTKEGKVPTLLLHSCCAPCSSYVLEYLSKYFKITLLYYNPNISLKEEYEARVREQKRLIGEMDFVHPVQFMEGKYLPEIKKCDISSVKGSVIVKDFSKEKFKMNLKSNKVNVIKILPGGVVTAKDTAEIELDANGEFVRNPEVDLVKVAVVERHQGTGNVACGFLKGYGIKEGAVALSVAHDSHNIIVVGVNDEEMEFAVNSLIEQEGGIVLVKEGKVIESMPMPIAGLMSDQSGEWVDQKLTDIHEKAYEELGICGDVEPVMTLCFMSLAVIPEIKLTDMGLFDVTTFSFIPVEVE